MGAVGNFQRSRWNARGFFIQNNHTAHSAILASRRDSHSQFPRFDQGRICRTAWRKFQRAERWITIKYHSIGGTGHGMRYNASRLSGGVYADQCRSAVCLTRTVDVCSFTCVESPPKNQDKPNLPRSRSICRSTTHRTWHCCLFPRSSNLTTQSWIRLIVLSITFLQIYRSANYAIDWYGFPEFRAYIEFSAIHLFENYLLIHSIYMYILKIRTGELCIQAHHSKCRLSL